MILDIIADSSRKRVANAMKAVSLEEMKKKALALPTGNFPFETALCAPGMSFICEIKKASPSKGIIAEEFPYLSIAKEYEAAGASAISVLTEPEFFLGSPLYLTEIHSITKVPLLRKDFTVHEYQIYEAKLLGASAVLLICALLDTQTLETYLGICRKLGLSALVEAHSQQEIESALKAGAQIIGVNNRNLKTFEVNIEHAVNLRNLVPSSVLFVAESGIRDAADIKRLHDADVNAVLIGETLMRASDKAAKLRELLGNLADTSLTCRRHMEG